MVRKESKRRVRGYIKKKKEHGEDGLRERDTDGKCGYKGRSF